MEKYLYIKESIAKHFVDFAEPLSAEEYNNLGETWQDYVDNKWVLLNEEQRAFYIEHPNATPKEVWDMEMSQEPERTLADAKREKIWQIEDYDRSDNVNGFTVVLPTGNEMETWIDRETRADYKNSLDAAELLGRTEVTPVFNGVVLTIPVSMAKMALAQIQLYANQCYNATEQHKVAVEALTTVADVDAYDNETGYPQKLSFELPTPNEE